MFINIQIWIPEIYNSYNSEETARLPVTLQGKKKKKNARRTKSAISHHRTADSLSVPRGTSSAGESSVAIAGTTEARSTIAGVGAVVTGGGSSGPRDKIVVGFVGVLITLGDLRVGGSTGGILGVGSSARGIVGLAAIALAVVTSGRTGRTRSEGLAGVLVTLGKSPTNAGVLGVGSGARSEAGTAVVRAVVAGSGGSGAGDEVVVGVLVALADMVHGDVERVVLGLEVRVDDPVSVVVLAGESVVGALGEAGVAASARVFRVRSRARSEALVAVAGAVVASGRSGRAGDKVVTGVLIALRDLGIRGGARSVFRVGSGTRGVTRTAVPLRTTIASLAMVGVHEVLTTVLVALGDLGVGSGTRSVLGVGGSAGSVARTAVTTLTVVGVGEVLSAVLITLGHFGVRSSARGVLRVGSSARSISGATIALRAAVAGLALLRVDEVLAAVLVTLGESAVRGRVRGVVRTRSVTSSAEARDSSASVVAGLAKAGLGLASGRSGVDEIVVVLVLLFVIRGVLGALVDVVDVRGFRHICDVCNGTFAGNVLGRGGSREACKADKGTWDNGRETHYDERSRESFGGSGRGRDEKRIGIILLG